MRPRDLRADAWLVASQGSTFGIKGVETHANFLRDIGHAEAIRKKLIANLSRAGLPGELRVYG